MLAFLSGNIAHIAAIFRSHNLHILSLKKYCLSLAWLLIVCVNLMGSKDMQITDKGIFVWLPVRVVTEEIDLWVRMLTSSDHAG